MRLRSDKSLDYLPLNLRVAVATSASMQIITFFSEPLINLLM